MENADIIFRIAGAADRPQLGELRWLMREEEGDSPTAMARSDFVAGYTDYLAAAKQVDWIASRGVSVIGTTSVIKVRMPPRPSRFVDHYGYLTNCFVVAGERSAGVGSRLLAHVVEWARGMDLELLLVWPSERAEAFYCRNGFSSRNDICELVLRQ